MNIFINISHPAHVHLFKNFIHIIKQRGHGIIVGARNKEFTLQLLDDYKIDYCLMTNKGNGFFGLLRELIEQQFKILKILEKNSVDLMLQMNGIFNAPVGKLLKIPTIALSDTENDIWANRISFSLTTHVFSPNCFDHKVAGTWKNQILYPGYHELAYLSPKYFEHEVKPEKRFLIRFVGWAAGHDIGEKGLTDEQKIKIVELLRENGDVYISSEAPLPPEIERYRYKIHPSEIHAFMAKCKMVVGESATMASEAACMGIPAIFISNTGRGYTTEQDRTYGLLKHFRLNQWNAFLQTLLIFAQNDLFEEWQQKKIRMLKDKIEVTDWLVDLVDNYPESIKMAKRGFFKRTGPLCVE